MTLEEIRAAALAGPLSSTQLAALHRLYEAAKAERLAADRKSAAAKKVEDELYNLAIDRMLKGTIKKFVDDGFEVALSGPFYVPHVDDWGKLQAHIVALGDFSLLERRVGRAAVQERWEHGIIVPGVEKYPVFKLTKTKVT